MRDFNRDRGSRDRGRRGFGGGFGGRGSFGRGGRDRQMSSAICSNCGKSCQVPFKPTGDKPVYCSDCFEKMGDRGERKSFDRPRFGERNSQDNQYKAQFEAVNAKLDKILSLLQPKPGAELDPEVKVAVETPAEKMEIKPPKSRKVTQKKAPEENERLIAQR